MAKVKAFIARFWGWLLGLFSVVFLGVLIKRSPHADIVEDHHELEEVISNESRAALQELHGQGKGAEMTRKEKLDYLRKKGLVE